MKNYLLLFFLFFFFWLESLYDKNQCSDFMSMTRELEPSGTLYQDKSYRFAFNKFEK